MCFQKHIKIWNLVKHIENKTKCSILARYCHEKLKIYHQIIYFFFTVNEYWRLSLEFFTTICFRTEFKNFCKKNPNQILQTMDKRLTVPRWVKKLSLGVVRPCFFINSARFNISNILVLKLSFNYNTFWQQALLISPYPPNSGWINSTT